MGGLMSTSILRQTSLKGPIRGMAADDCFWSARMSSRCSPAGDVGTVLDQEVHAIAVDPVLTTSTDPDSFLESHTEFFEQCPSRGARSRARAISTEDDTSSEALSISSQFSGGGHDEIVPEVVGRPPQSSNAHLDDGS